jgi:hypothetical protein
MTTVGRWSWRFVIAGAVVLAASVASGQSASPPDGTDTFHHGMHQRAHRGAAPGEFAGAMLKFGMHATAVDAELKTLVADMNMFTGDLKIEAMARVLTLLVERQSAMREQMTAMHGLMMHMMAPMEDLSIEGPSGAVVPEDVDPGSMCVETP